ncbi:MAG: hypothetical protein WDM89_21400 [Rhizomicrobium sp.]
MNVGRTTDNWGPLDDWFESSVIAMHLGDGTASQRQEFPAQHCLILGGIAQMLGSREPPLDLLPRRSNRAQNRHIVSFIVGGNNNALPCKQNLVTFGIGKTAITQNISSRTKKSRGLRTNVFKQLLFGHDVAFPHLNVGAYRLFLSGTAEEAKRFLGRPGEEPLMRGRPEQWRNE